MNRSCSNSNDFRLSMDNYEVIRTVGSGSFGEVVLAKDKKSGEECAIKILEKSFLARVSRYFSGIHSLILKLIFRIYFPEQIKRNRSSTKYS